MSVDALLSQLTGVRRTGSGRWIAKCPAHNDRSPSLSVRELNDGRILVHCFASCEVGSILAAVDLGFSDLYPERPISHRERGIRFNPRDLLLLVAREAWVVALAAEDISRGKPLNSPDHKRLLSAVGRILRVADATR